MLMMSYYKALYGFQKRPTNTHSPWKWQMKYLPKRWITVSIRRDSSLNADVVQIGTYFKTVVQNSVSFKRNRKLIMKVADIRNRGIFLRCCLVTFYLLQMNKTGLRYLPYEWQCRLLALWIRFQWTDFKQIVNKGAVFPWRSLLFWIKQRWSSLLLSETGVSWRQEQTH